MRVSKRQLRRIIKETMKWKKEPGSAADHGDMVLRQAYDLFADPLVQEMGGEIVVDTGVSDAEVEASYGKWIELWPNAMMEEGGLIYTGIMV
jgi:hypothetical protein